MPTQTVGILGAGLSGCCVALALANRGIHVNLLDQAKTPMSGASLHNEGKLHLGYVYAADPESLTHQLMCLGSLTFNGILEHLTGISADILSKSTPFKYAIPVDSQLPLNTILKHFSAVDETIALYLQGDYEFIVDEAIKDSRPLLSSEYSHVFNPDNVQACIQTDEIALETRQVAAIINNAVLKHPLIMFMPECKVLDAEILPDGTSAVRYFSNGSMITGHYPVTVNCLWDDRLRVDKTAGIIPERSWLLRYKAAITFNHPAIKSLIKIPSVTFITGAYGDIVYHDNGMIYISWYPKCKLAETGTIDCLPLYAAADSVDKSALLSDSLNALSKYVPSVSDLLNFSNEARIGGGVIFAWGDTDITDPASVLHQRHMIGPHIYGNWISVDTGKYCMAPYFALQVADSIRKTLL